MTFENCDMSGLVGRLADFEAPDTLFGFVVNGDHPYSKFSIAVNSGTIANVASGSDINGRWYAAAAPSAAGIVGMRVYLPEAAYGTPSEYTATTNSASASTWRQSGQAGVSKTRRQTDRHWRLLTSAWFIWTRRWTPTESRFGTTERRGWTQPALSCDGALSGQVS